ncbi:MAG: lipoate--protein ligase family protein [Planctomycetota bacterium]|nr:MAG: lipoate--protein ligase family protein [Planctomycetota bacterium]
MRRHRLHERCFVGGRGVAGWLGFIVSAGVEFLYSRIHACDRLPYDERESFRRQCEDIMKRLDLSLPTPEENLALDEALLDAACAGEQSDEILRFWESSQTAVIVGRASKVEEEVDTTACRARGVPVLRRISGGAAVVVGPGCLMYALILSRRARSDLVSVDRIHRHVLRGMVAALRRIHPEVCYRGINDLTLGDRKFCGNSLRVRRDWVLYHGTLLLTPAAETIEALLRMPPRRPEYRRNRSHGEFVTHLPADPAVVREAIATYWQAETMLASWPKERTGELVARRYARCEWHLER